MLTPPIALAVLVVTHDPRVQDIADRIIHLDDGHLNGNEGMIRGQGRFLGQSEGPR